MFKLQDQKEINNILSVTKEFITSSKFLKNMLNDLNIWGDPTPIKIPLDFLELTEFYTIFLEFNEISFEDMNLLQYLDENIEDFIKNYPEKNKEPPFMNNIFKFYESTSLEKINNYIKIADYLDMMGMIRILSIILSLHIKNMDNYEQKFNIYKSIRQRLGHIK